MSVAISARGIIEIIAEHDGGKTIAALQTIGNMKKSVFVDDDTKGDATVRQMTEQGNMEFGLYIDLAKERAKLSNPPTADELLYQVVIPTINKIKEKKWEVIVWDTWRIVYQAARGHVERNQSKYANVVRWQGSSTIIQGLISKVARMIEVRLINELKDCCDLLVITHHIKDRYVTGEVVGKIPESSATLSEVCTMRLWLRRNHASKVPIILFLKRPNAPKLVSGKIRFVNIVPLKITPTDKHESIWDAIAEYEAKPIQSRKPTAEETPTTEELEAISGTLSDETKSYLKSLIEYNKQMEKDLITTAEDEAEIEVINVPQNVVQLLTMSKDQLEFDMKQIQDLLGLSYQDIGKRLNELPEFWKQLQEHKQKMATSAKKKK